MKTVEQVREMLEEAREKYATANSMMRLEHGECVWNEGKKQRDIASAEIRCFMAVLGSDGLAIK